MLNIRLAGDHLFRKLLFAVDYGGVFLCCPFSPRDVFDEI